MKKYLVLLSAAVMAFASCNDKNKGNGNGDEGGENPAIEEVAIDGLVYQKGEIYYLGDGDQNFLTPKGDYTLDASKTYILRGWVYVQTESKLTIPAGTVVKGLKSNELKGSALIIEPGGQIFAQGTADKPIVFTSDQPAGGRKPGDWGGLVICGKAKNNQNIMQIEGGPRTTHGGTDDADNSGVLSYVRIEFAGYPFQTDQEINGLTLGSVGSGTKIDHVQVSYSNDDSFEWFGGAVNCSHLVAYHGWDDDFDTDNGFSGKLQFLLGVRHPKVADQSLSNGFESDNNSSASKISPYTAAAFCNVTLVGPIGQDADFINESGSGKYIDAGTLFPNNGSRVGQFQAGIQIRRNSRISLTNSLIMGYPVGLIVEDDKVAGTEEFAQANNTLGNIFFAGYTNNAAEAAFDNSAKGSAPILGSDCNKVWKDWSGTWDYGTAKFTGNAGTKSVSHAIALANGNRTATVAELLLDSPVSVKADYSGNTGQNYGPKSGSPLVDPSFTVPAGFDASGNGFSGAFKSNSAADNWTVGWTNFDPQNTVY